MRFCLAVFIGLWAVASHAVELRGELAQGGLLIGQAQPGEQVWLDGKALRLTDNGLFAFGFDRDAKPVATLKICAGDACREQALKIRQREYDIQRIEGVPQNTVTPPPEVLDRIRQEGAMVSAARRKVSRSLAFAEPFIWPLQGPITGVFGSQRVYNGEPRRPHYGVDVAAPTGTPVVAPADAIVRLAHPDMYFSGGTLVMDHGYGISSTFIHLSEVLVKEGQTVRQGEPVARVGASGRATGPHLDWRMNWFNVRLDPVLHVGPMPAQSGAASGNTPQN
ncbi:M23 family metallopeptidase [Litorivivens sp.]|uniref:M23 family metallopeptidase n=1 Tax=Litorivivens sp. TaxID=2020868 RepID=UPI003562117B